MNYTELAISQFMYQSSTSLLIGYFKTDNRSITALFQGEVEYLNLTNYYFSRVLDLFRFIKHANIKFVVSQRVWHSQESTQSNQILGFKY